MATGLWAGPALVAPPVRRAHAGSLVATAGRQDPDVRWEGGVRYDLPTCPNSGVTVMCTPAERDDTLLSTYGIPNQDSDDFSFLPVDVWASIPCSAMGMQRSVLEARAREALDASASFQLERLLWNGAGGGETTPPNAAFFAASGLDSNVAPYAEDGTARSPRHGLAWLQRVAGRDSLGASVVIHADTEVVSLWDAAGMIRREGERLFDLYGNPVVAGSGYYAGTGPDGETDAAWSATNRWAYASGPVEVRLGEVVVTGADNVSASAYSGALNELRVFASRAAVVSWISCPAVAVRINPTT